MEEANHAAEFDPPKELAEKAGADETTLVLNDASGLAAEAVLRIDDEPEEEGYELVVVTEVTEESNEIEVERGALSTDAVEHEEGAHVFQGPVPPADTITGAVGTPPCGQLAAATAEEGSEPVAISGTASISMGDNFFDLDGQRNPNLAVNAGESVSVQLTNIGSQPHNMRTTGADGEFDNNDDAVSDPDLIAGGGAGTLAFSFTEAGTYEYRCDFHPDQMRGEIAVAR
jgi:plastocyanin